MAEAEPLRLVVLGAGRIASLHVRCIAGAPGLRLAGICAPGSSRGRALAEHHAVPLFDDPAEAVSSPQADAVVVATPTATHADLVGLALDRGKPVLCEKPVALDPGRIRDLAEEAARKGVPAAVGFQRRFHPAFAQLIRSARSGAAGEVDGLLIVSRDAQPPSADYLAGSGGIFADMTVHDIDLARLVLGEIVEVTATAGPAVDAATRSCGDADTATVILRSAAGSLATLVNLRRSPDGLDQRLTLFGSASTLVASRTAADPGCSTDAAFEASLREFARLVRHGRSDSPDLFDAHAVQRIADAATLSARTGNAVPLR